VAWTRALVLIGSELVVVLTSKGDYHRRQAATLVRLAQTTRDQDTAAALMQLASQHIQQAEAEINKEPK
jgi:hypothetical protein